MDPSRAQNKSFLLDTCVASLILNGQLWSHYPSTLVGCKPELYAAWRLVKEDLGKTYKHKFELDKSIKAWKWVSDRLANGSPLLTCH